MYSLKTFQRKIQTPFHFAKMIYEIITSVEEKKHPIGKNSVGWYLDLARKGVPEAQFILGVMYDLGEEVDRDLSEAFVWYRKSAENGLAEGKFIAGLICKHGIVSEKDEAMASKLFTEAAESGLAAAQLYAGRQSLFGASEEADYLKALGWFLKAAEQGLPMAQEAAGAMYNQGIGVDVDKTKAFEWFLKAADQNLDTSQYWVGESYYMGEAPPEGNPYSFEFVSHLEYLNSPAHYRLGPSLPQRRLMHVNLRKAFRYFSLSAEQKNTMAMRRLGEMFRYGEGVPKDKEKAEYWINRAEKLERKKNRG